jgi:hypothetical protein
VSRDIQVKDPSDSSNNVLMSASQFQESMATVMKGSNDLNARMKSEDTKLSESIKAATVEMSLKIEIAKILSDGLTKQFRAENASLKEELSSKLKSEIFNLRP